VARLRADGFEGIQLDGVEEAVGADDGFPVCGQARINVPSEADAVISRHARLGERALTLHVGWGMEDNDTVDRLVEAILRASNKHALPVFIETHRATITQDMWRTVELTKRFPEVRFNGDFSHYYCGQEMVYGDWLAKLDYLQPVFDRVGFLHGRVASPGCIQASIESPDSIPELAVGVNYLEHFKMIWRRCMRSFQAHAGLGDVLVFAPELLRADIFYARLLRTGGGALVEECDRYAEALMLRQIALDCFAEA
jgi:hypothetical protein